MSGYSSSLREALVPLVADHKCSSPEVYGADISPNMLCAGYFDCRSDACQVSQDSPPGSSEPKGTGPAGPARRRGRKATSQSAAAPGGRSLLLEAARLLLETLGAGVRPQLPGRGLVTKPRLIPSCPQGQGWPRAIKGQSPFHPEFSRVGLAD